MGIDDGIKELIAVGASSDAPMTAGSGFQPRIRITHIQDCMADPNKIRVIAELSEDIGDFLPYLAALLPQAGYNHGGAFLSMPLEGRLITVYPQVVVLAKARDENDALEVLEWLRGRIAEAHDRREELVPCFERHRSPRLLDAYRLLPGGNCKRCGRPTCLALAALLVFGEARIAECPRLSEPEFARNRQLLLEWLG